MFSLIITITNKIASDKACTSTMDLTDAVCKTSGHREIFMAGTVYTRRSWSDLDHYDRYYYF